MSRGIKAFRLCHGENRYGWHHICVIHANKFFVGIISTKAGQTATTVSRSGVIICAVQQERKKHFSNAVYCQLDQSFRQHWSHVYLTHNLSTPWSFWECAQQWFLIVLPVLNQQYIVACLLQTTCPWAVVCSIMFCISTWNLNYRQEKFQAQSDWFCNHVMAPLICASGIISNKQNQNHNAAICRSSPIRQRMCHNNPTLFSSLGSLKRTFVTSPFLALFTWTGGALSVTFCKNNTFIQKK